jgi:hypothetical protein
MANNALFINIACLLWASNISPLYDARGKPIIPDTFETADSEMVVYVFATLSKS